MLFFVLDPPQNKHSTVPAMAVEIETSSCYITSASPWEIQEQSRCPSLMLKLQARGLSRGRMTPCFTSTRGFVAS
jgi:hypothetical protein